MKEKCNLISLAQCFDALPVVADAKASFCYRASDTASTLRQQHKSLVLGRGERP